KNIIDNNKFIRCDRLGQALIKTCPGSSNWNAALNQCSSSTVITTPRPQCPIPAWDNPNEIGTALPNFYPNPCHADSRRACDYIYMKNIIDNN
ncbi:chitin-binding domain-containing protein, partial [Clostridium perfringens]|nr:chitin-binding domain-containing protein [Clostridium perfringens]